MTRTKVVAAIDNSAAATPVLGMAAALAYVLGAEVEAVSVRDDDGATAEASAARAGVPFRAFPGDVVEQLVALAASPDVVALALGARSRPIGRRPLGPLALELADAVDKPVLLVPPDFMPPDRLRRVLIAMEGTPEKARAARSTVELANAAGLEVVVVHVDDEASIPSFSDQTAHETAAYSAEFLDRYCTGSPEARLELRVGDPAGEVLAAIESEQPDMIVLGWRRGAGAGRRSTGGEIIKRSPVPILLVAVAVAEGSASPSVRGMPGLQGAVQP